MSFKDEWVDKINGVDYVNAEDINKVAHGLIELEQSKVDGITPHIGDNGNWFFGDIDSGVKAEGIDGEDGYTPIKDKDYFDGDDGISPTASVQQTSTGAEITITDANGTTSALIVNGKDGVKGDNFMVDVKTCGAVGDGTKDDTSAFQTALANNRKIYVPSGTYKLSGELVIRDNCGIELAQDAVLNFVNTTGNCITLNRSAFLKGNHATVFVPYSFTGKVINVDTTVHTAVRDVVPWTHWDPQWKTARYLTDLNICKANSNGLHYSNNGDSNGTAVYISADGSATSTFIWGMNFSGLRIAGAFEYAIRAVNFNNGWNHEMRIEAFIDAAKIGVSLEDCNNAYISATIQPRRAADDVTTYAVHGIQLIRCENTDLSGSRVWDWNDRNSLWTYDKSNTNQHIAMYGNCVGTILNDYNYHYLPSGFDDIREIIYCEEAYKDINFGSLIVLQEPLTRWFKPVNNEPYFSGGNGEERLVLKKEQDALFQTDYIPAFTDKLAQASDGAGGIFNEIGYKEGYFWNTSGTLSSSAWHTCTGYISATAGKKINVKGMSFKTDTSDCRVILYKSNFDKIIHINRGLFIENESYYYTNYYTETEDGFSFEIVDPSTAYFTISVYADDVEDNPVIAVGEDITYTQIGTLASGIKVNEQNLIGMEGYEKKGRMTTQISNLSTDNQYPSAKAVYTALQNALGEYVTDIASLIGGDA